MQVMGFACARDCGIIISEYIPFIKLALCVCTFRQVRLVCARVCVYMYIHTMHTRGLRSSDCNYALRGSSIL